MPEATDEQKSKEKREIKVELQNGASGHENSVPGGEKPKRPSTAELLHLKEIVERGEFAGPTIIETVKCEKDMEAKAFEKLLNENVRLERDLRKAETKLAEAKHNYDVKFVELDSQKDETDDLKAQVKHLERKIQKYKRRKYYEDNEKDGEELVIADELEMKETVRDLQLRLTRVTADQELKDKRIYELEKELKIEKAVCVDLSLIMGVNGEKKAEELRKKHESAVEMNKTQVVRDQRHNVVVAGSQQSKVCRIM